MTPARRHTSSTLLLRLLVALLGCAWLGGAPGLGAETVEAQDARPQKKKRKPKANKKKKKKRGRRAQGRAGRGARPKAKPNAKPKKEQGPERVPDDAAAADAAADADSEIVREGGTEVKVMSFSGIDVEGRLKSPQLLYFVNRVRAEFDRPSLPHRSFMPELQRSTRAEELE